MTKLALTRFLLVTAAIFGCGHHGNIQPLAPAADIRPAPLAHRITLLFDEDHLPPPGSVFQGTNAPIEDFIYDSNRDRILVPGFFAIDRSGSVTFDPDPLTGPPDVRSLDVAELYATWVPPRTPFSAWRHTEEKERERTNWYGRIMAVWYGTDTIVVLCAQNFRTKAHPHAHRIDDAMLVRRLDARTLNLLEEVRLPLHGGLDARESLQRFLRDGTLIVGFGATRHTLKHARQLPGQIPRRPRGHALVRLDPDGTITSLYRSSFFRATITPWDEIVVASSSRRRSQLIGLRLDGTMKFRRQHKNAEGFSPIIASHRDGFCTRDSTRKRPNWSIIACYDRDGNMRWRRGAPWSTNGWVVDDSGWIYLERVHYDFSEIVAVTPEGLIAWRWRGEPSEGGLLPIGEALCFTPRHPTKGHTKPHVPELVCLRPRHVIPPEHAERIESADEPQLEKLILQFVHADTLEAVFAD